MLKAVLLSTAAIALIATSANAHSTFTLSKDSRFTSVLPHTGQSAPARFPGSSYVVSTIDKSKVGAYFCCYGNTISGPSSIVGGAFAVAEQFVPTANATISTAYAGVGYVSGDDKVTLTLYADSGSNSPGKMMGSGSGTSTTEFGFCCGLVKAKLGSQSLKAGTPYWVAISASGADWNAANFQVNNEVNDFHYLSFSSNGGSTWSSGVSETEYNPAIGLK